MNAAAPRTPRPRGAGQGGLSLIELMVALGLGLFLILGVVNVFIANRAATELETALSRLQENGRLALGLLTADLHSAMHTGCASALTTPAVLASNTAYTGLLGFEQTGSAWSPPLPSKLSAIARSNRPGSDVVNIQGGLDSGMTTTSRVLASSRSVSVSRNLASLEMEDQVVLANCSGSHIFTITNRPGSGATQFTWGADGNDSISVDAVYEVGDSLLEFTDRTWYVTQTSRRSAGGSPVYALMRRIQGGSAEEMVEGVEYLQVIYGERLDNGNLRYVAASDPALDMARVVSLRVGLLLQSLESVLGADDSATYRVLDQAIGPDGDLSHNGDRGLRRVFVGTVALRNAGAGR